jgi:NTP pyrophosphatase (non-canonical NTP hydrolase)
MGGDTMTMALDGLAKLAEECGELIQVIGKRLAYYSTDEHPDGTNLRQRMIEELGDVQAAIEFLCEHEDDDFAAAVDARSMQKVGLFRRWDALADNNEHAVRGPA